MRYEISQRELEALVIDAVDVAIERVDNGEAEHYDARLVERCPVGPDVVLDDRNEAPIDTHGEIKTCQVWIRDRGSGSELNRRRGRFEITRRAHRELVEVRGIYVLAVLEGTTVVSWCVVDAPMLTPLVDGRWTSTTADDPRERVAQLPWPEVFDEREVSP